jgi:beta-galactosidase
LIYPLPFDNIDSIKIKTIGASGDLPAIKKGTFDLEVVADTYFDMSDWGKGVVWVNGHHLGRYWSIGPQQTIYMPAEWLKKGRNTVTILELIKAGNTVLKTVDKPVLDHLQPVFESTR